MMDHMPPGWIKRGLIHVAVFGTLYALPSIAHAIKV
jgi:hypothetical protein